MFIIRLDSTADENITKLNTDSNFKGKSSYKFKF